MTIGDRIRKLRKQDGNTLEELAPELGIAYNTLGAYERGERLPPIDKVVLIAKHFGVSVDYLLGLTSTKSGADEMALAEIDEILENELEKSLFRGMKKLSENDKRQLLKFMVFLHTASDAEIDEVEW